MKKMLIIILVVLMAASFIVPPAVAGGPSWGALDPVTCIPSTPFQGWIETEFQPDGGLGHYWDLVVPDGHKAVIWGNEVNINGVVQGKGHFIVSGPSRWAVYVKDGAFRVGEDQSQGDLFPEFWSSVLTCLYGDASNPDLWSPIYIGETTPAPSGTVPDSTPQGEENSADPLGDLLSGLSQDELIALLEKLQELLGLEVNP